MTITLTLSPAAERFVLHWGEMGSRWGVNRTVAQVHALLFVAPQPLDAETITETLGVARSNVSTSLKELQGWNLVLVSRQLGDRRDYFSTPEDPWELFRIVLEERKRREIDPTIETLRDCIEQAGAEEKVFRRRVGALLDFLERSNGFYSALRALPTRALKLLADAGDRLPRWLGVERKE